MIGWLVEQGLTSHTILEVHRKRSGRLSAPNNRPITDCLFPDASSFNKSRTVTIVKSQWYDRRLVTLLLQFH